MAHIKEDYSKDLIKEIEQLMLKCDNLSQEIKTSEKKHKKEIKELQEKYDKRISKLEEENEKLRNDNDRLKKIINNNSDNSSKPPSSDTKKNIPNNREKSTKKRGGQKGHKGVGLNKKDIEKKIENKEIEHEIINVGEPQGEYVSKYIIDVEIRTIAREYRFYKDKNGKYNIPKELKTDVQYGAEIKTICAVLNTEGVIAIDRLAKIVSCISQGKIKLSNGTIVNFVKELGNRSREIIENIKEELLNSTMIFTDGTGSRCNGKKHIECNVHIARYLKGCFENTGHKWALKMRSLLCSLNEYRKKLKQEGIQQFTKEQLEKYLKRYDEIINEGYERNKTIKKKFLRQEEQKLLNRLVKYKENHTMFLIDFNAPFDNNLSERDIRHVKTKQKISGYFNNLETCKLYCNIKSVIITLKKQSKDFYSEFRKLYENNPAKA